MRRRPRPIRAHVLWLLALFACPGTPPPPEHYGPPPSDGPDAGEPDDAGRDARPEDAGDASDADATEDGGSLAPPLDPLFADCGEPPTVTGDFTRARLREAALACTEHQLCGYRAAARALSSAVDAYVDEPGSETREEAREAYRAAMALWSRIEVMQYGPLGSMVPSAGEDMYQGEGLREQVYAWPLVSSCRVDEQVVEREWVDEGVASQLVSAKGLFALEYLLFADEEGTGACSASDDTTEALAAMEPRERAQRRRDYAAALAEEQVRLASQIEDAYAPGGAYAGTFLDASGYPNEQEAMNVLAWSLIYVERELKDWKLGVPAGMTMSSPVREAESARSGISSRLLDENLDGFARLFEGCGDDGTGVGFDDWLEEVGHGDLARDMLAAHADARAAVSALPDDLGDASSAQIRAAYEAVRALTTLLKGDFFGTGSPLNLALPASVEGDTD